VKVENPLAYSFIMQDELYLLKNDKNAPLQAAPPAVNSKTQLLAFNFMGGNKKNFLIITHYPATEFIQADHLAALESVLKRLGLETGDVAIFNRAKYMDAAYAEILDYFRPQKLLLLGKMALHNGPGQLTLNKPQQLENCNTLLSFAFEEMMDNNEYKKAFWEQMKLL
jgi:DNA polymerase III psi subunit